MPINRSLGTVLMLISTSVVIKILFLLLYPVQPLVFENDTIARNFIEHGEMYYMLDGNKDYNHQFPLYDSILIVIYSVFGFSSFPVQVFQIIINALFALVVVGVFNRLFPAVNLSGIICVFLLVLALFHPLMTYYQIFTIHPVTVDIFLFALLVYVGFSWIDRPTIPWAFGLFLVTGLAMLERPTLVVALLPVILKIGADKRRLLKFISIVSFSFMLFLMPWMFRNLNMTGHFQLTSGTWRYLWVGIQKDTEGTNILPNGESYYALMPDSVSASWGGRSLDEQMAFYEQDYLNAVRTEPLLFFEMFVTKLKNIFWFSGSFGISHGTFSDMLIVSYKVFHFSVLFFALLGLTTCHRRVIFVLLSGGLCLALIQSFFYVETRHSLPIHFMLWISAAIGLMVCFRKIRRICL